MRMRSRDRATTRRTAAKQKMCALLGTLDEDGPLDVPRRREPLMTKKTFVLDEVLLAEAKAACGAATDTGTVHAGLRALVTRAAHADLAALLGTARGPVVDVPRRRAAVKRRKRGAE